MDWNGWHALTGIVMWTTAIAVSYRADFSRLFPYVAVVAQLPIIAWIFVDARPLELSVLPTTADLVIHALTVVIFAVAIFVDRDNTPARVTRSYP